MKSNSEIICPICGSDEVSKPRLSAQAFAISILLLGFPLPFANKTCYCFDCGESFKKPKRDKTDNNKTDTKEE